MDSVHVAPESPGCCTVAPALPSLCLTAKEEARSWCGRLGPLSPLFFRRHTQEFNQKSPFGELSMWQVASFYQTLDLVCVICRLACPSVPISIELTVYIKNKCQPQQADWKKNMFTG